MNTPNPIFRDILDRIEAARRAAGRDDAVRLLAVSKTRPAGDIAALASLGQRAFGENYVQEALAKQREVAATSAQTALQWHLIGPLQSNKCREVALHFDWLQTLDRAKLIEPLARFRGDDRAPLDVLIQVNIDDESSKSGCAPADIDALASTVSGYDSLRLRGLMAIPAPKPQATARGDAFRRMRGLFERLRVQDRSIDTLSMGMSADFELAIAEGATLVRIGSALFGARA